MLATAIDDDTRLLQIQEIFISKNVLKVVDPSGWNSLSYQGKQKEFRDTCFAIHEIVVHKLYRGSFNSLENYFKKRWSVSRAQVYRLHESATILKLLGADKDRSTVMPHKERMCRQLKSVCGLLREELQLVWSQVLESTAGAESQLSNFNIEEFWNRKNGDGTMPLAKSKSKPKAKKGDQSDTDYSDNDSRPLRKRQEPEVTSGRRSSLPVSNPERLGKKRLSLDPTSLQGGRLTQRLQSGLERDWMDCQDAMQALISRGYVIESKINGEWTRPSLWKLCNVLDVEAMEEPVPLTPLSASFVHNFDDLILAASNTEL
jgi:hypothetical protein